jgi:hypothetical protein
LIELDSFARRQCRALITATPESVQPEILARIDEPVSSLLERRLPASSYLRIVQHDERKIAPGIDVIAESNHFDSYVSSALAHLYLSKLIIIHLR